MHVKPEGYKPFEVVYLVEFEQDGAAGQLGAFTTLAEAELVLSLLNAEQRHGPLHINAVPVHSRLQDWQYDR